MRAEQPITLTLQDAIAPALRRLRAGRGAQCLSDLTFANLYLFRAVHQYRYLPGAWPAISGRGYDGARYLLPLFDATRTPWAVLLDLLAGHDHLYPLDGGQAGAFEAQHWMLTQARNDADYLYAASTFVELAGRALSDKRGQLRQFRAACQPDARPYGPAWEAAAGAVLAGWMAQKGKTAGQADETPCREAFQHAGALGLEGFIHFDGERPIGIVLGELLEPGVYAIRFAKGLDDYPGIYPYLFQHFCLAFQSHFGRPVTWLNFEQDMGIPGLRRSKLAYQPAALLPKFRLALRD